MDGSRDGNSSAVLLTLPKETSVRVTESLPRAQRALLIGLGLPAADLYRIHVNDQKCLGCL